MKKISIFSPAFLYVTLMLSEGLSPHIALAQQKDEGPARAAVSATPASLPVTSGHRELFLIGYLNSDTSGANRTATVVSIINQGDKSCEVSVDWFKGLDPGNAVCTTVTTIDPGETHEHCSRNLPGAIALCQATCAPELTFDEGKAIMNTNDFPKCSKRLAVDARLYHTTGSGDEAVAGVADLKVIRFGQANRGD